MPIGRECDKVSAPLSKFNSSSSDLAAVVGPLGDVCLISTEETAEYVMDAIATFISFGPLYFKSTSAMISSLML